MSVDTIIRFGPQEGLVGVLSGGPAARNAPTLILFNAGMIPRAGPFRLHAELAGHLAARGLRTFRFDLPGVGETSHQVKCDEHLAASLAMDHLAREHGCSQFVVGGVCSAADLGWRVALEDARVAGLIMLDGVSYTGPWFHFARIAGVLRRPPGQWPGVLARLLGRLRQSGDAFVGSDYRQWPERDAARRQLAQLVARNTRMLCIYTGGMTSFLHPRQFAWSFGPAARDPRVAMHYWSDCDHTFYARVHRDRLLETVGHWLESSFDSLGERS